MSISLKAQKMLWGRAANRCAICKQELVMDATETDDASLVGEACHIVAQSVEGPRGQSGLSEGQRDKYENLILLCNVDHKLVDDQPNTYTVKELHRIKSEHEGWIKYSLAGYDEQRQRDEEIYAGYVEEWERRVNLNEWKRWASFILYHGQPSLRSEMDEKLPEARDWLLSRIWSHRYEKLEEAFTNFRIVLQDFHNVFHEHAAKRLDGFLETEKFYHIDEWNEEKYQRLADQFDYHVALVADLILELTRAANYVCDRVREFLIPSYRISEGVLLIESGPHLDLSFRIYRVEYRGEERTSRPYPGLEQFKRVRFLRDFCFGENEDI